MCIEHGPHSFLTVSSQSSRVCLENLVPSSICLIGVGLGRIPRMRVKFEYVKHGNKPHTDSLEEVSRGTILTQDSLAKNLQRCHTDKDF
jgi:hypothetical protein